MVSSLQKEEKIKMALFHNAVYHLKHKNPLPRLLCNSFQNSAEFIRSGSDPNSIVSFKRRFDQTRRTRHNPYDPAFWTEHTYTSRKQK